MSAGDEPRRRVVSPHRSDDRFDRGRAGRSARLGIARADAHTARAARLPVAGIETAATGALVGQERRHSRCRCHDIDPRRTRRDSGFGRQQTQALGIHTRRVGHRTHVLCRACGGGRAQQRAARAGICPAPRDSPHIVGGHRSAESRRRGHIACGRLPRPNGRPARSGAVGGGKRSCQADHFGRRTTGAAQRAPPASGTDAPRAGTRDSSARHAARRLEAHTRNIGTQRRRQVGMSENNRTASIYGAVRFSRADARKLRVSRIRFADDRHRRPAVDRQRSVDILVAPYKHARHARRSIAADARSDRRVRLRAAQ